MELDQGLAQRVRETLLELADFADIHERKMFGALMTLVNGHMTCGISGAKPGSKIRAVTDAGETEEFSHGLVLRVGANRYEEALADPHCHAMDMAGRTMTGFVYVAPSGLEEDADLRRWLELSLSFVLAQPPK